MVSRVAAAAAKATFVVTMALHGEPVQIEKALRFSFHQATPVHFP